MRETQTGRPGLLQAHTRARHLPPLAALQPPRTAAGLRGSLGGGGRDFRGRAGSRGVAFRGVRDHDDKAKGAGELALATEGCPEHSIISSSICLYGKAWGELGALRLVRLPFILSLSVSIS